MSADVGVWLYAVAGGEPAPDRDGPAAGEPAVEEAAAGEAAAGEAAAGEAGAGVGGAAVRVVRTAGLAAYVSTVSLDEFGEQALRRNLEDLDWLADTARAHHAVIAAVGARRPVVPMRLATVYRSDERVARMLADGASAFWDTLERIRSREEWGVKVYAAPAEGDGPPRAEAPARPGPDGPGAAYLRRRRAQVSAREDARRAAAAGAEAVHAELSRLARAARLHPPQAPQLAGADTPMMVNGAYLVDCDRAGEFAEAVRALADRHPAVRIELTGPWPPYSFATVAREAPA